MPIPKPRKDEKEKEFISRCTGAIFDEGTLRGKKLDADKEADRKQVVAVCYGEWRRNKEEAKEMEILELARQAIETARAVLNGGTRTMMEVAEKSGRTVQQVAERMLDGIESEINEAATSEPTPEQPSTDSNTSEVDGDLRDIASGIDDAFEVAYAPATQWREGTPARYSTRSVFMAHPEMGDSIIVRDRDENKLYAVDYTQNSEGIVFVPRAEWKEVKLTYKFVAPAQTTESEPQEPESEPAQEPEGAMESFTESLEAMLPESITDADDLSALSEAERATVGEGRRAPVLVDMQLIEPGPGNQRDGHYYPAEVLKRDIHVFKSAEMFACDHKESERSERTKVGIVLDVPTRFTEKGAPVGRVLIYDPDQAEKTRNRADRNVLSTMQCSIFGTGTAKRGKVGEVEYNVVESLTEGKYLELVSKAGAGGHALNLAESEDGGVVMDDRTKETIVETPEAAPAEAPPTEVQEVKIEEATPEPEAQPVQLTEAEVGEVLDAVELPESYKVIVRRHTYTDKGDLAEAIVEVEKAFKETTAAGSPVATRGKRKPLLGPDRALIERNQDVINQRYLKTRVSEHKEEAK